MKQFLVTYGYVDRGDNAARLGNFIVDGTDYLWTWEAISKALSDTCWIREHLVACSHVGANTDRNPIFDTGIDSFNLVEVAPGSLRLSLLVVA